MVSSRRGGDLAANRAEFVDGIQFDARLSIALFGHQFASRRIELQSPTILISDNKLSTLQNCGRC